MRTYIYVDSFNLYYGALRSTPYKWLNLASLFRSILRPHHQILKIKYFTALVDERPDDPKKPERQNVYLRARKTYCPEIEIYYGKFLNHRVILPMANNPNNKVEVIKTEEKGSDVNLAVNLLNDAILDKYECAVVVSNDSDLAPAMQLVKERPNKMLGLLTPGTRHPSRQLREQADFCRKVRKNQLKKINFH